MERELSDEITRVIRHKWGKVGPLYLFRENSDLSLFSYRIFRYSAW